MTPEEVRKYGYDHQAKGESVPQGSHLNPNPRTNKQLTHSFTKSNFERSNLLQKSALGLFQERPP